MTIQDQVGDVNIEIGNPSTNHIRLHNDHEDGYVILHIAQWGEIKQKIDKMFKVVRELQ